MTVLYLRMLTKALKRSAEGDILPISLEFSDPTNIKSNNKGRPPKKGKQRKKLKTITTEFQESLIDNN